MGCKAGVLASGVMLTVRKGPAHSFAPARTLALARASFTPCKAVRSKGWDGGGEGSWRKPVTALRQEEMVGDARWIREDVELTATVGGLGGDLPGWAAVLGFLDL